MSDTTVSFDKATRLKHRKKDFSSGVKIRHVKEHPVRETKPESEEDLKKDDKKDEGAKADFKPIESKPVKAADFTPTKLEPAKPMDFSPSQGTPQQPKEQKQKGPSKWLKWGLIGGGLYEVGMAHNALAAQGFDGTNPIALGLLAFKGGVQDAATLIGHGSTYAGKGAGYLGDLKDWAWDDARPEVVDFATRSWDITSGTANSVYGAGVDTYSYIQESMVDWGLLSSTPLSPHFRHGPGGFYPPAGTSVPSLSAPVTPPGATPPAGPDGILPFDPQGDSLGISGSPSEPAEIDFSGLSFDPVDHALYVPMTTDTTGLASQLGGQPIDISFISPPTGDMLGTAFADNAAGAMGSLDFDGTGGMMSVMPLPPHLKIAVSLTRLGLNLSGVPV